MRHISNFYFDYFNHIGSIMRPFTNHIIFCLLATVSQIGFAQSGNLSTRFSTCMDKSGGVTATMLSCIGDETNGQDFRLNRAYKELMGQLSVARRKRLQDAQVLWIKYRDANCNFYADPDGGTLAALAANDCVMSATANRASELERLKR